MDVNQTPVDDEFTNWRERQNIEVVDTDSSNIGHHNQLFEMMLEDVAAPDGGGVEGVRHGTGDRQE